jgi:SecD/SecF fusion protein
MRNYLSASAASRVSVLLPLVAMISGCLEAPDINKVGGVIYVYQLAATEDGESPELNGDLQSSMISVLETRLDPTRKRGIRVTFNKAQELEIAVPGHDPDLQSQVQARAASTGRLEFLILANQTDHADLIEQARRSKSRRVRVDGAVVGRWIKAQTTNSEGGIEYRGLSQEESILRDGVSGNPVLLTEDERIQTAGNQIALQNLMQDKGVAELEVLVAVDADPRLSLRGEHLASVRHDMDGAGRPCISFRTTPDGGKILERITRANLPEHQTGMRRRMGIILDDILLSAPAIMSPISGAGQITGNFTRDEVNFIVNVLKAGELPLPLNQAPVRVIDVPGENRVPETP